MKSKIRNLFIDSNYEFIESTSGDLYFLNNEIQKDAKSFWLVIESEDLNIIDFQSELFDESIKAFNSKDTSKNISLIILKKITSKKDVHDLKSSILHIEEDPFLFKKYVLYYSDEELKQLGEVVNELPLLEFIKTKSTSSECFETYKEDPFAFNWQSLIYRILLKVPFLDLEITSSIGLTPLFNSNQEQISTNSLINENEFYLSFLASNVLEELADLEVLDKLNGQIY